MAELSSIAGPGTYSGNISLQLKLEGEDLSGKVGILSASVRYELNRVGRMSLSLQDIEGGGQGFEASGLFHPGDKISLKLTRLENAAEVELFSGLVVEATMKLRRGMPVLELEARDLAVQMTQGRVSASFNDESDHDVLERILDKYSLQYDLPRSGLKQNSLVQYQASDWDFLLSRVEANGWVLSNQGGQIKIFDPAESRPSSLDFTLGINMLDFEGKICGREQFPGIEAASWDPSNQEILTESSRIQGDDSYDLNGRQESTLVHGGSRSGDELQAWADSASKRRDLARIRGRVLSHGHELKTGDFIRIKGMGPHFEGEFMISGISHEISGGSWYTHTQFGLSPASLLEGQPDVHAIPASGLVPAIHGLQTGTVEKLEEDPGQNYRIKVRMPVLGKDQEGVWARLASPDAGEKRGFFFLPHEGEEVLLGFVNGDPRDPVILGSLFSQKHAPPLDHDQDNPLKGFYGKNGLQLQFDEKKNIIELKTQKGNLIRLTEEDGELLIADENQNEWLMSNTGISMKSQQNIKIEATQKLELKANEISIQAQSNLEAKGLGGAKFESAAQTVIKGAMVDIN